jgi:alpha-L-fucosidase
LFGLSLTPAINNNTTPSPVVAVRRAKFSQRWQVVNGKRAQVVEIALSNILPMSAHSVNTSLNSRYEISIAGRGIQTITSGSVHRLAPGDQVHFDVLVTGTKDGGEAAVVIKDVETGKVIGESTGWVTSALIKEWKEADLDKHESPAWVLKIIFQHAELLLI